MIAHVSEHIKKLQIDLHNTFQVLQAELQTFAFIHHQIIKTFMKQ